MTATIKLLRLYTNESAYFGDRKVFDVVIARALQQGLAGATALQALSGFGKSARLRSRHMLDETRSVVVEIIDEEARLRRFVEVLNDLPNVGLITLESVEVLRSGTGGSSDA